MSSYRTLPLVALVGAALLASTPAQAHPKIVAASPAANAVVARPNRIELHFSERLVAKFSTADLMMTGMKDHPPMKVASGTSVAADGRTLIVAPARPLASGSYRVDWRVVSVDTHHVSGTHAFSVK